LKFIFTSIVVFISIVSIAENSFSKNADQSPLDEMVAISDNNPDTKKIAEVASGMNLLSYYGGRCLKAVKDILEEAGIMEREELPINAANDLKDVLAKKGWINLIGPGQVLEQNPDPCRAPSGSVLVFKGIPYHSLHRRRYCGNGKQRELCGHTEIKVGGYADAQFKSDATMDHPVTGIDLETGKCLSDSSGYSLIGVMVPPMKLSSSN
jgi:hypothetical protein